MRHPAHAFWRKPMRKSTQNDRFLAAFDATFTGFAENEQSSRDAVLKNRIKNSRTDAQCGPEDFEVATVPRREKGRQRGGFYFEIFAVRTSTGIADKCL